MTNIQATWARELTTSQKDYRQNKQSKHMQTKHTHTLIHTQKASKQLISHVRVKKKLFTIAPGVVCGLGLLERKKLMSGSTIPHQQGDPTHAEKSP